MQKVRSFKFGKLVRSKLPDILTAKDIKVHVKKIDNKEERLNLLKTKVNEEITEAYEQKERYKIEKDLTDAFDALLSIANEYDIELEDLISRSKLREEEDGTLQDGVYIDYIEITDDNPNLESFTSRPHWYKEL